MNASTSQTSTVEPSAERAHRIVFVNTRAGASTDLPHCLADFEAHDIGDVDDRLPPLIAKANGTDLLVAVWGGDGSIRSVATHVAGTQAALLPGPGGTHNHFANMCGIATVEALEGAVDGDDIAIDVGMAGDDLFLNNVSFGWYSELVRRREKYQALMPRKLAKASSVAVQIWQTRRIRVSVNGEPERIWMAWIGNGEHSLQPMHLTERFDAADGVLDVRLLRGGMRLPKLAALFTLISHNRQSADLLMRSLQRSVTLQFNSNAVRAAVDGELVRLPGTVQVVCRPKALIVRMPSARATEE